MTRLAPPAGGTTSAPNYPGTRDDARLGQAGKPGDRTAAVAWASFPRATVVTIPRETVASTVT
ncbi:hypothetical protein OMK64_19690, partial [Cellulomonas fimi]|nr:hypothetical protein [Cellulomonas fimi]